MAYKDVKPNPPGVMQRNNKLMISIDSKRERRRNAHDNALKRAAKAAGRSKS